MLQQSFKQVHLYYPFRLAALVIIPDHWHGLIRPGKDVVIEQVVGNVKRNLLNFLNLTRTIGQQRFLDHRIRNGDDFSFHCEYIESQKTWYGGRGKGL